MKTTATYYPRQYWNKTVEGDDVDEVGHPDMGRAFNRWAYKLRREAVEKALVLTGLPREASVFEAAFGVGFYLALWKSRGMPRVTGVDISQAAVEKMAMAYPACDLRCDDLKDIAKWPDWNTHQSSYDLATAIDVIYHIVDDAAAAAAIRSVAQTVKPGGVFIFTEKFPVEFFMECDHVRRRPFEWYDNLLKGEGFALERSLPIFSVMDPPLRGLPQPVLGWATWCVYAALRFSVKYWKRNTAPQLFLGTIAGAVGYCIDHLAVSLGPIWPNLKLLAYRREEP